MLAAPLARSHNEQYKKQAKIKATKQQHIHKITSRKFCHHKNLLQEISRRVLSPHIFFCKGVPTMHHPITENKFYDSFGPMQLTISGHVLLSFRWSENQNFITGDAAPDTNSSIMLHNSIKFILLL